MAKDNKKDNKAYPLKREDLKEGNFYQCDNGTTVLCLHTKFWHWDEEEGKVPENYRIVNIANGIGNYQEYNRFRPIEDAVIHICVDKDKESNRLVVEEGEEQ